MTRVSGHMITNMGQPDMFLETVVFSLKCIQYLHTGYFVQFMNCSNTPMKMYFCVNFIFPHLITEGKCISKKDKYIYKNFPFLKICHTYTKPATKH